MDLKLELNKIPDGISKLQFCLLSPEDILNNSVVEITKPDTYTSNNAVNNGLFDTLMGPLNNDTTCKTCGKYNDKCPGHFGHLILKKPVYFIQYVTKRKFLLKLLKCICIKCGNLLCEKDPNILKIPLTKRLVHTYNICKKITVCGKHNENGCGAPQAKRYELKDIKICAFWEKEKNIPSVADIKSKYHELDSEYILKLLKSIKDEELKYFGMSPQFSRPEWMVCTVLPIPPPCIRPSIKNKNQRSEDDLTHVLVEIIKTNNNIGNKKSNPKILHLQVNTLQYHVATYMDNNVSSIPKNEGKRSTRAIKSITERIKGKDGRLRGNIMGKRVDFSARSVITPDDNICIDELGVPLKIAKNMTYPEIVSKYNKEKLVKMLKNKVDSYPVIKSITKKSGGVINVKYCKMLDKLKLEIGDTIHRTLLDGDIVLFNRQPSLHKMSMMAHKVKVLPYNSFHLNVSVTTPYNADFDGDEMNMHVPQSIQTAYEIYNLSGVQTQIISPSKTTPIIALVQDSLLGIYLLSQDDVYLNRQDTMQLMFKYFKDGAKNINLSKTKYSGNEIISFLLPKGLYLQIKRDDDYELLILDGEIIKIKNKKNYIDKSIIKKIIHVINNDFTNLIVKKFIEDCQYVVRKYILLRGFSVGMSDVVSTKELEEAKKKILDKSQKNINNYINQITLGILNKTKYKTMLEEFEQKISLNSPADLPSISTLIKKDNRINQMVISGSKGSAINISQMSAFLSQQAVDGKRIPYGFKNRTLPHFYQYDDNLESRGFIKNSLYTGLNPFEFYFHAIGGREGLIDTAVKTSETGYIQRKLVKSMEDLHVAYDNTIRNSSEMIIQFRYNNGNLDTTSMEKDIIKILSSNGKLLSKDEYINKYGYTKLTSYNKKIYSEYMFLINNIYKNYIDNLQVFVPIRIKRLILKYRIDNLPKIKIQELNLALQMINNFILFSKDKLSYNDKYFIILIRQILCPQILLKLSINSLDNILKAICSKILKCKVNFGEMVGPLAAQSIGEPTTQLTLNTFHFAGVGSKSKVTSSGVPRLKEILSNSNVKKPTMTIYINTNYAKYYTDKKKIASQKKKIISLKNNLEVIYFKDIIVTSKIYPVINQKKNHLFDLYSEYNNNNIYENTNNSWCIDIEFNKLILIEKDISMFEIEYIFNRYINDDSNTIIGIFGDDNADNVIAKIFINASDDYNLINTIEKKIQNIIIKGLNNINNIYIDDGIEMKKTKYLNNDYNQWILYSMGTNLLDILALPEVDSTKTISSNLKEVVQILGIEAARQLIILELDKVLNSDVNINHINLLADNMTCRGKIYSLDRHGIPNKCTDLGPIVKASFEEMNEQIFTAAVFAEQDNCLGVSSNILLGQGCKYGTGQFDISLDLSKLNEIEEDNAIDLGFEIFDEEF